MRELGFGMLPTSPGPEINGRIYAINRFFGPTAIHLVGCGVSLDRRAAGVRGAAAANPHGLVQEFLNRSEGHLWAVVSNGLRFRVLRDNQALSRQSYLEFDLESMFAGELFSDFVLLWLMAHATRFAVREEGKPESCWLEQWTKIAAEQGTRALESLRGGVEKALQVLGQGFVGHPRNTALRETLRSGQFSLADFHAQLLRVVYRLIFLFVAEDRTLDGISLLHPRDDSEEGRQRRERYAAHYSTARLRDLASHIKGSRHGDLWQQFNLLVGALSGEERFAAAREQLAIPVLGSFLWSPASTNTLNAASLTGGDGTEIANADFLEALRNLAFTRQDKMLRPVDYRNLGSEEFGGVYESFLALTPQISGDGARFSFAEFAGNERKTSGSYYTPDCLVQCLLDSALDPVVEEAIKGKTGEEAEKAILKLKVCDTAAGSGHFLVGAAHRLARHLARVRAHAAGESEPSPKLYQHALRDVIGHCLYGVDINPMAVELCKVTLWLEALEPGKPLSFLDHHIQCGNSLLGATPALIEKGIPDEAFTPIEGDDKEFCKKYKKRNKEERTQMELDEYAPWEHLGNLPEALARLDALKDDTIEGIQEKQRRYEEMVRSSDYIHSRFLADVWCAAFVWKKCEDEDRPYPITNKILRQIERNPQSVYDFIPWLRDEIMRLARQYQFFHWHLAFPEVFPPRGADDREECKSNLLSSGFDVILGNPPWERVKIQEKEWFAERSPEIANAPNAAARKRMISALERKDPVLQAAWQDASRQAEAESQLIRNTDRYPLCGRGDINTYTIFTELNRCMLKGTGRVGCIVPSGIATDDTTKVFFQDLVEKRALVSLYSFENESLVFPGVHHAMKFSLLTLCGANRRAETADLLFFARSINDLRDPDRHFVLTGSEIARVNPNTMTCPAFRSKRDAILTLDVYHRLPVLILSETSPQTSSNPWRIRLTTLFHMANDSSRFLDAEEASLVSGPVLPLYEAKMIHQFDHRFGTYAGQTGAQARQGKLPELTPQEHSQPSLFTFPHYWLNSSDVRSALGAWDHPWLLGWRGICRNVDSRTVIASIIPLAAVGDTFLLMLPEAGARAACFLQSQMNSFIFDYLARQKFVGSSLKFYTMSQLPTITPEILARSNHRTLMLVDERWIVQCALELTFTSWDLELFAQDSGWSGPPFRWDGERRFLLRCELDAAFFHLYLPTEANGDWHPAENETADDLAQLKASFPTPRDAVDYIMETFPIVKRKDEAAHGYYRTKDTILQIYDAMQRAIATGQPYQTLLNPTPGPPCDAQGNFISMYRLDRDNWPKHIHPVHPDWEESLLAAWFGVCQKLWTHLDDDQIFPWDGREAFVYALIPYLAHEKPGEKFEFYRDAALLASRSDRCEALLLDDTLRAEYRQGMDGLDWLQFPDAHRIRPRAIREALQNKRIIQTDAKTGATTIVDVHRLPPLPPELKPLLPMILKAADNLDRLQRRALETAEAANVSFTYEDITREFAALSLA
ncbi:MAG: N-6 DNA methylase [Candidatus Hydrogenedentes bacterium]|nr:N-6 DNA methylase [Candidatus Hydrogenedentota bacterium]